MLTTEQLATLKAAILAETDPTFVEFRNNGDTGAMAAWFNSSSVPPVIVWRTSVTQDEIMQNGFDWVRVDNLSVGKARIWEWLFDNQSKACNPSKLNVRAGIDECWKGTAADLAVRGAVYVHCKRTASKAEAMFAIGSGTDVSPSLLGFDGEVVPTDIVNAIGS